MPDIAYRIEVAYPTQEENYTLLDTLSNCANLLEHGTWPTCSLSQDGVAQGVSLAEVMYFPHPKCRQLFTPARLVHTCSEKWGAVGAKKQRLAPFSGLV